MISRSKCRPLKRLGDGVVIGPLSQSTDSFHRLHQNQELKLFGGEACHQDLPWTDVILQFD
jgi:hypothetical protein